MREIRASWLVMFAACAACAGPNDPEIVPPGYAGSWSGTTGQGTAVSFTVVGEQATSFNLAFRFSSACSGSVTLPGPATIAPQVPPGPPPFDQPGFAMGLTVGNFESGVALFGAFSRDRRSVSGEFKLITFPGCDSVMHGTWSAQRR